ncbi:MAG: MFS transporter [Aquificaceae bacterium]|nr:MFS transporter [Aquificaceae bacterium]MDW8434494.1 MFS transporter [Aquificaceae bacterium]
MKLIETDLTCRLDSIPWTSFHTRFVLALGITWVLDAFEVVIVSAVLKPMAKTLQFSQWQSSMMVSGFLIGAIIGSILFGYLADKHGRKKLFLITLLLYSGGTFLTGFATNFETALLFRVLAGAGLGGEFAAIQSAIDEFVPSRHRGKVDGTITALWNLGSIMASLSAAILLKTFSEEEGWRVAYFLGAVLSFLIVFVRLYMPESPRWLISKERIQQAEEIVERVEREAGVKTAAKSCAVPVFDGSLLDASKVIIQKYPWRFVFSASMSWTILTTYYGMITLLPLILSEVYGVPSKEIPKVLLFGSIGGLIGGLVVASLVDKVGRVPLGIAISLLSGLLSFSFLLGYNLNLTFFVYSLVAFSFASVAYVVATEIYPSYIRAYAIGLLSVVGRVSGALSPVLLVNLASINLFYAILCLSIFWFVGLLAFLLWSVFGMETKGKSLEDIT